jgi:hypothetical protein
MSEHDGPLTPAHLLARTLDQVAQINAKMAHIETQLEVHLQIHKVWSRIQRAAYAGILAVLGSMAALLVEHWK